MTSPTPLLLTPSDTIISPQINTPTSSPENNLIEILLPISAFLIICGIIILLIVLLRRREKKNTKRKQQQQQEEQQQQQQEDEEEEEEDNNISVDDDDDDDDENLIQMSSKSNNNSQYHNNIVSSEIPLTSKRTGLNHLINLLQSSSSPSIGIESLINNMKDNGELSSHSIRNESVRKLITLCLTKSNYILST